MWLAERVKRRKNETGGIQCEIQHCNIKDFPVFIAAIKAA